MIYIFVVGCMLKKKATLLKMSQLNYRERLTAKSKEIPLKKCVNLLVKRCFPVNLKLFPLFTKYRNKFTGNTFKCKFIPLFYELL